MNVPLEAADKMAARVIEAIAPFCAPERCVVAGSVRRRVSVVHDVDIVCQPTDIPMLKCRCLRHATQVHGGDCSFAITLGNGVQVDFFFARGPVPDMYAPRPSNWGSVLLCRTGSKEHNMMLARRATALGLRWHLPDGIVDKLGHVVSGETEESLFRALDLAYVEPEER